MATLEQARQAIADAVTSAGTTCLPWPEDAPAPPIAWVDTLDVDWTSEAAGGSFCASAPITATVVSVDLRNDRPGATKRLESALPLTVQRLEDVPGLAVLSARSGVAEVGRTELPAVIYTVLVHMDLDPAAP